MSTSTMRWTAMVAALTAAVAFAVTSVGTAHADPTKCTIDDEPAQPTESGWLMGTEDDDEIVCTGDVDFNIMADQGSDTITINGNVIGPAKIAADAAKPDENETVNDTVTINGDIIGIEESGKFVEVQLGSGDDKLSARKVFYAYVNADEGNDSISVGDVGSAQITGGWGDDTIRTADVAGASVNGSHGNDTITVGAVGNQGTVDGEKDNDVIEAQSLGAPSPNPGRIVGGEGSDRISGIGNTELIVGPANGVLDGDQPGNYLQGTDTCNARTEGSGVIVNCP